jgi:glutamate-5-semialdehyde dehydrogenase
MKNLTLYKLAQSASYNLAKISEEKINSIVQDIAREAINQYQAILDANAKDLAKLDIKDPKYDRLLLNKERIENIANELNNVSNLKSPLNVILEERVLPNGLLLQKKSCPLGVIGIIYEARPNVTFDCTALSIKSGNAVILKGGSDAMYSNMAIVEIIKHVLKTHQVDENIVTLLPSDRSTTEELLNAVGYVDVLIPRGSQNLINYVRQNAKVPVIETGAGIVHVYFDQSGDIEKGRQIIFNSKTRRVSVCNALDCLIIHQNRLNDLATLIEPLAQKNVLLYADEKAYEVLKNHYPAHLLERATEKSFGTEFLDYKMAIKTVANLEEALEHIKTYSSKHSEAIVAEDTMAQENFLNWVDAAAVYANASTAFTDGAQFGMGAEIGISTQKLHARGPMALPELTSYKWVVRGNGQVR